MASWWVWPRVLWYIVSLLVSILSFSPFIPALKKGLPRRIVLCFVLLIVLHVLLVYSDSLFLSSPLLHHPLNHLLVLYLFYHSPCPWKRFFKGLTRPFPPDFYLQLLHSEYLILEITLPLKNGPLRGQIFFTLFDFILFGSLRASTPSLHLSVPRLSTLGLPLCNEDGGSRFLWNVAHDHIQEDCDLSSHYREKLTSTFLTSSLWVPKVFNGPVPSSKRHNWFHPVLFVHT
jgi:hypothetical protein